MPVPAITIAYGLSAGLLALVAPGLKQEAQRILSDTIEEWAQTLNFRQYVTARVNAKIAAAGLSLQFRDVLDQELIKEDLDNFATAILNARLGIQLTRVRGASKDEVMIEVGRMVAQRINSETGAALANVWPPDVLRAELASELARAFDLGDYSGGNLFPRAAVAAVEAKIMKRVPGYKPERASSDADALKRAKARARQAKYARTHRQVWVPK